jgi:hypothetical protein
MKVKLTVISLILSIVFIVGCARNVTPMVNYGNQMVVTVTLRGTPDNYNNRYFLVLSDNASYQVPLPPPNQRLDAPEFIEPDMIPINSSREAYFTNYFSTWSGYIVLDTLGYSFVKGPFNITQAISREVFQPTSTLTSQLTFTFHLSKLYTTIPNTIYFDFVTVPWPNGREKNPADSLLTSNNSVASIVGTVKTVDDVSNPEIDAGLDILSIKVEVQ